MWKTVLLNNDVYLLAFGMVLGMLTWDLAFETRQLKSTKDINMLRFYYQGIHKARIPVALILPVALIVIFSNLVFLAMQQPSAANLCALCLAVIGIAIEIGVAVPKEIKLWKKMETPSKDDSTAIQTMFDMIHTIRNTHISIYVMFLIAIFLTKDSI